MNLKDLLIYKILREIKWWLIDTFFRPFVNLAGRIKDVVNDHFCEKRLGIYTTGSAPLPMKSGFTLYKDSVQYVPTPYHVIKKMLERIELGPSDVFVDLGCGKGRVIFSAAEKRLKRVIGVEARKEIADIAAENLKNLKLKNTPVDIINADAAVFDVTEGTIFFMYQPFGRNTAKKVVENIKTSLAVNPRKIRIVCYSGPDLDSIEGCDWLTCERRMSDIFVDIWRN